MSLTREFSKYVLPTMAAYALMGVYVIVDGLFVGNFVGDAGLAGISIANPIYTVIGATGTGIGVGGSVISSIKSGEGDTKGSERAIGTTSALLLVVSLPIMAIVLLFSAPLNAFLGGEGMSLKYAVDYTNVLALGAPFQIMAAGLIPVIRNRGFVKYAMITSIISGIMNAGLDLVFVAQLKGGTAGAATATVCSQIFLFACCAILLSRKDQRLPIKSLIPNGKLIFHMLKIGFAPFCLVMLPVVTIAVVNINAMAQGGEQAVAAYGVIAYVTFLIQILIQSIGDGAQPLISRYLGAGEIKTVKRLRAMNYLCGIALGFIGLAIMTLFSNQIPTWFGTSPETAAVTAHALPIFSLAYVFYGFTHASTTFFYAIDSAKFSNALVCIEAAIVAPLTYFMACLLGIEGVWWSFATVQLILGIVACVLVFRSRSRIQ